MTNTTRLIHAQAVLYNKTGNDCGRVDWKPGGVVWTSERAEEVTCPDCLNIISPRPKEIKPK